MIHNNPHRTSHGVFTLLQTEMSVLLTKVDVIKSVSTHQGLFTAPVMKDISFIAGKAVGVRDIDRNLWFLA